MDEQLSSWVWWALHWMVWARSGIAWLLSQLVSDGMANLASVLTAIVALWVWAKLNWDARRRRNQLELFLKIKRERVAPMKFKGLRSALRIMRTLPMTEEQILSAAFSSKRIRIWSPSPNNPKAELQFQFDENAQKLRDADLRHNQLWTEGDLDTQPPVLATK